MVEGDLVLLDSTHRPSAVGGKVAKLRARYDGPYKVLQVLNGGRDVRVELSEGDKSHDVFHISKIKLYKTSETVEDC